MMNPELKAEWVNRLRSGQYEQGTGHLSMDGKYCCLGVLAEILAEQGKCERVQYGLVTPVTYGLGGTLTSGYLHQDLTKAIGLPHDLQTEYADMNDRANTFSAIADAIEADSRL
jgi:hypothetical protein